MDIERILNQFTGVATACSGVLTVFSGWTANEWGIFIGVVLTLFFGIANMWVSIHFKRKEHNSNDEYRREELRILAKRVGGDNG